MREKYRVEEIKRKNRGSDPKKVRLSESWEAD